MQPGFMEPTSKVTYYEDVYGITDLIEKDNAETYAFDICESSGDGGDESTFAYMGRKRKQVNSYGSIEKPKCKLNLEAMMTEQQG